MNTEDFHISRKELENFIYGLCNAEKKLKSYFQLTGKNIPINSIYKESENPQSSFGYAFNTDLQCVNEKNYFKLKESLLFSETDWIHPFFDISIHKHMAYFPAFIHKHSFYELCYVLSGSCQQTVYGQNQEQTLQLNEGNILIIPPDLEHKIKMDSESSVVNILIRKSTFKNTFLQNLPADTPIYEFFLNTLYSGEIKNFMMCHANNDSELIDLFFDIAEEYCNNEEFANNIINQELSIFFSKLLRKYSKELTFGYQSENCLKIIPAILQYINLCYAETSVQDIADHFNFNTAYLSKQFKQETGSNLIDTLIQTRISKAQFLLRTTTQPVDHIAEMVGYSDTTYFIRKFKQIVGSTPLQYRKKNAS